MVYARLHGGVLEVRPVYMRAAEKLRYKTLRDAFFVLVSWLQPVQAQVYVMRAHGWDSLVFRAEADVDAEWGDWEPNTGWAAFWRVVESVVRGSPQVTVHVYVVMDPLGGRYAGVKMRLEMGEDWLAPPGRGSVYRRSLGNAIYVEGDNDRLVELHGVLRAGRRRPWLVASEDGRVLVVDDVDCPLCPPRREYKLRIWDERLARWRP